MLRSLVLDYNGFFAACEQQERPELRGRPVAVAPLLSEATSCIASSYDARRRGVKVGTPVHEARLLCPGIVILESRPEVYIRYHEKLIEAVSTCIPVSEVLSIDELWCELPPSWRDREKAVAVVKAIKLAITRLAGTCLTCSAGIAPNPWLAKVASDMQKPDGLVVIEAKDLPNVLHALQLRDLPGIGANLEKRLRAADITTVEALTAAPSHRLHSIWGSIEGERMWRWLRGEFVLRPATQTSSLGHSHVLPPELRHEEGAHATVHRLLQKAAMRLRHSGYFAGGLHLAIRFQGRDRWSTAATFLETQDTLEFIRVLKLLWSRRPKSQRFLSVGVTLFQLTPQQDHTGGLAGIADTGERRSALHATVDHINRKLGKNSVVFGGALGALRYAPIRIAFNRIPDVTLEEGEDDGTLLPTDEELANAIKGARR
ncbi:MAG: hypothetical protein JNN01_04710 [Opitutaceae bacterium]|nr:hypothetical protein [Opitutaceae bacterium]